MKRIVCFLLLLTLLSSHVFGLGYEGVKPSLGTKINWGDPLARGLVGCWLMNEGSGNTVYDLSGNGKHLTMSNTTWVAGRLGPAIGFNGTSSYLYRDDSTFMPRNNIANMGMTIMCYFDTVPTDTDASANGCIGFVGDDLVYGYVHGGIWWEAAGDYNIYGELYDTAYRRCIKSYSPKSKYLQIGLPDSWVYTYDPPGNMKLYIGGNLVATAGPYTLSAISARYFLIGRLKGVYTPSDTKVSHAAVWNRALTATEVQQLYMTPFRFLRPSFDTKLYGALAAPPAAVGQLIFIQEDED